MEDDARRERLVALWDHVTNVIKRQIVNPTLWLAMETARPITLDGSDLILGIEGAQFNMASIMEQHGHRTVIEKQLSTAARAEIHFRVIQGTSLDEWNEVKNRDQVARELASQPARRPDIKDPNRPRPVMEAARDWDEVNTNCHRIFTALSMKSVPQARARYIMEVMPVILEGERVINPSGDGFYEDRGLSRVIEKVAQLAETDSTTVALEYARYRDAHRVEEAASNQQAASDPTVAIAAPEEGHGGHNP